jgi:hypothetical protein
MFFADLMRASNFVTLNRNRRESPFEPFAAHTFLSTEGVLPLLSPSA